MNINNVLSIGMKVALALGAGLAMFMGVSEAVKRNKETEVNNPNTSSTTVPVKSDKSTGGTTVVNSLRAAQSTCGKLFTLSQGLVNIAESISSLFNKSDGFDSGYSSYYGGGGNQRWRRVNPFIMESVPSGAPINYNGQYPI